MGVSFVVCVLNRLYLFPFAVQEQSPNLHNNENGLLIHNGTHSEPLSCTTSLNLTPLNNINNSSAKKNTRIMHSTQYLNQFNNTSKHPNAMFVSGGNGGKGLKKSRFISFKQNSEKRKMPQTTPHQTHFQQQQTPQQRPVKKDTVKLWLFKGFTHVSKVSLKRFLFSLLLFPFYTDKTTTKTTQICLKINESQSSQLLVSESKQSTDGY